MNRLEAYLQLCKHSSKICLWFWMISGGLFIAFGVFLSYTKFDGARYEGLRQTHIWVGIIFLIAGFVIYLWMGSQADNLESNPGAKMDSREPEWESPPDMSGRCVGFRIILVLAFASLFCALAYFPVFYATHIALYSQLPVPKWLYSLYGVAGGAMMGCPIWRATSSLFGVFGFREGNLYARQMLMYGKQPLDLIEYLTDLDPWSGEPFPGTKSAWRMAVYLGRYPDQADAEKFEEIMAELRRSDSVYGIWWTNKSASVRSRAETLDGVMRKCFKCCGEGKERNYLRCNRCDENGEVKILEQNRLVHEEDVDYGDNTHHVMEYQLLYRHLKCPDCNGTKQVVRMTDCTMCHGVGSIPFSKREIFYSELRKGLYKEVRAFVEQTQSGHTAQTQSIEHAPRSGPIRVPLGGPRKNRGSLEA